MGRPESGTMVLGRLALAAWLVTMCGAVAKVKFMDVSASKGIISRAEMDIRNFESNKYWGCVIADFDRDGIDDMLLPNHGNNPDFYWGTGNGFVYQNPRLMYKDWHGAAALDVDGDGDLDFFLTRGGSSGTKPAVPYLLKVGKGNNPRNLDKELGKEHGFGTVEVRGRSASVLDVDCDGDLDILFVNKKKRVHTEDFIHVLYENMGNGKFVPRTNLGGLESVVSAWFHVIDVDNDGSMDILMMGFSGAELWMGTCSTKFAKDTRKRLPNVQMPDVRAAAEIDYNGDGVLDLYLVRGSKSKDFDDVLLENRNGFYVDVSRKAGIPQGGSHYHVLTLDANNDGWTDLYISRSTHFKSARIPDLLLLNAGGKFENAGVHGTESKIRDEDGDNANALDYDGDGRVDIITGSRKSPWRLYRNTTPYVKRKWITVVVGKPRAMWYDPGLNRSAMGAKVRVVCFDRGEKKEFVQRVGSQGQSHSQSYMEKLHFGVGRCKRITRIHVDYVGGFTVSRVTSVAAKKTVTIGIYNKCPRGRDGLKCDKVIPNCSTTPCPSGKACEVMSRTGQNCSGMDRCDPSGRKFGMSCTPKPCLKLYCRI